MSNFFDLSDGKSAKETGKEFSAEGSTDPIPKGTNVQAICEAAKWDESDFIDGEFIQLTWAVLKPSEYENRKVFQKLKVNDPKAGDKAKKMLVAIDANAKGQLVQLDEVPTNEQLEKALLNRPMVLKLGVWDMNDKKGNWVTAVSPKASPTPTPKTPSNENEIDI